MCWRLVGQSQEGFCRFWRRTSGGRELGQIAVAGPRRIYRVEAWGEVPRLSKNADGSDTYPPIRRTLTGVWDTKVVTQNARNPEIRNGSWVYLREN